MSKDSQSISESSTSSVSTVQNFADSFNQTANDVRNLSNVGNMSLGFGSDIASGMFSGSGAGTNTSSLATLLIIGGGLVVLVVIVLAIAKRR